MYLQALQERLPGVRERIEGACRRAERRPGGITIVAVTKGHPLEALRAAREVGLSVIGESRVQEADAKREEGGDLGLTWHMIGHLQRNKVRTALDLFTMIHSVDSLRLAREIEKEAEKADRTVSVLVQVNASGEESKYGFPVERGIEPIGRICELDRLRVLGLMTMAPLTDDEAVLRSTFRRTRELFECCGSVEGFEPRHLSMGMTNDYEIAIEEGSTMVRLGTALFGERPND